MSAISRRLNAVNPLFSKLLSIFVLGVAIAVLISVHPSASAESACYVSPDGSGTRSGERANSALAWQNGEGVKTCLARSAPGGTIYVAAGEYALSDRIVWDKSGTPDRPIRLVGSGPEAIADTYGQSVLAVRDQWPTIRGDRPYPYSPQTAGDGSDFIQLGEGVSHVEISNFNLFDFHRAINADSAGNQSIRIKNLYAENIRQLMFVEAGCAETSCNPLITAADWDVSNLYVLGVSKQVVRTVGLRDSTFRDIYADVRDSNGQMHWDDWPLLFHFTGPSEQILVERTLAKNPVQHTGKAYDNGDCYTAEEHTANITFRGAHCLEAYDSAFDLKGGPHFIEDAIALKVGNRAFRVWDGPVAIRNALAAYDGDGEYTQAAEGSNAAIWVSGEAIIDGFTSINSTRPFIMAKVGDRCGALNLSNSLMVLDQENAEGRSLEPDSECDQASSVETNVRYQTNNIPAQTSLYDRLVSIGGSRQRGFFSLLQRLLHGTQRGFVWPNDLPLDWFDI